MVKPLLLAALLCAALTASSHPVSQTAVEDIFDNGSNPDKRPLKWRPRKIDAVKVYFDGQHPLPDRSVLAGCEHFVANSVLVKNYFKKAKQVSVADYLHVNDWSACDATGEARMSDGRRFFWHIQQLGSGYIIMGKKKYYFNCENC